MVPPEIVTQLVPQSADEAVVTTQPAGKSTSNWVIVLQAAKLTGRLKLTVEPGSTWLGEMHAVPPGVHVAVAVVVVVAVAVTVTVEVEVADEVAVGVGEPITWRLRQFAEPAVRTKEAVLTYGARAAVPIVVGAVPLNVMVSEVPPGTGVG